MSGRNTRRTRIRNEKAKTITLSAAQKKTGLTTKSEIESHYRNEGTLVRYNGKKKEFYLD